MGGVAYLFLQLLAFSGHDCLSYPSLLGDLLHFKLLYFPLDFLSMCLHCEKAVCMYNLVPGNWHLAIAKVLLT